MKWEPPVCTCERHGERETHLRRDAACPVHGEAETPAPCEVRRTFCPEHGFGAPVDEDGTCSICGATAVGSEVDRLVYRLRSDPIAAPPSGTLNERAIAKAYDNGHAAGLALGRAEAEGMRDALRFYAEKAKALAAYAAKKHGNAMEAVAVELMNDAGERGRRALDPTEAE